MGNDFKKIIEQNVDKKIVTAISALIESSNTKEVSKAADTIAVTFGSQTALFTKEASDFEEKLISSFQKNLSLLIQKTWVEKADADLKEQVLYKLEEFCKLIKKGKWSNTYSAFLEILNDIVYLMFGSQAKSDDFVEYALRIDPEFGIFWFFVKSLPTESDWQNEKTRIVMLLGMYFLANY